MVASAPWRWRPIVRAAFCHRLSGRASTRGPAQVPPEVVGQVPHARVTLLGLPRGGAPDDGHELARDPPPLVVMGDGPQPRLRRVVQYLEGGHALEGQPQGDGRVQHQAERALVAGRPHRRGQALGLLGRHEGGSAHDAPLAGLGRVLGQPARERDRGLVGHALQDAADAPVHEVDLVVAAEHDVRRLQVAVDDPLAVRVGHRVADLEQVLDARGEAVRLVRLASMLVGLARFLEVLRERAALDELHGVGGCAAGRHLQAVDGNDVGVVELRGDLDLADEAQAGLRIAGRSLQQLLERDLAQELGVARDVDRSHPAAAGLAEDHVARLARSLAARRTGGQRGRGAGFRLRRG
jgi:hypothetical protein